MRAIARVIRTAPTAWVSIARTAREWRDESRKCPGAVKTSNGSLRLFLRPESRRARNRARCLNHRLPLLLDLVKRHHVARRTDARQLPSRDRDSFAAFER